MRKTKDYVILTLTVIVLILTVLVYLKYTGQEQDVNTHLVTNYEYNKEGLKESYTDIYKEEVYLKDIVLPKINIDSIDADNVNYEIKTILNEILDIYKSGKESINVSKYTKYEDDNILSVNFSVALNKVDKRYYGYNFDIKTGKLLSYEEVYKIAGLTKENIDEKVKILLSDYYDTLGLVTERDDKKEMKDGYIELIFKEYQKQLKDNILTFHLDENKNLNINFHIMHPIQSGLTRQTFIIK